MLYRIEKHIIKNNFNDDFSFVLVTDNYKLFVKEETKLDLKDCTNHDLCNELVHRLNRLNGLL